MKKTIIAIGIVVLFLMTTFASATMVTTEDTTDPQQPYTSTNGFLRKVSVNDVGWLKYTDGEADGKFIFDVSKSVTIEDGSFPCKVVFNVKMEIKETRETHTKHYVTFMVTAKSSSNTKDDFVLYESSTGNGRVIFADKQVDATSCIKPTLILSEKCAEQEYDIKIIASVKIEEWEEGKYVFKDKENIEGTIHLVVGKAIPKAKTIEPQQPLIKDQPLFSLLNKLPMFERILERLALFR